MEIIDAPKHSIQFPRGCRPHRRSWLHHWLRDCHATREQFLSRCRLPRLPLFLAHRLLDLLNRALVDLRVQKHFDHLLQVDYVVFESLHFESEVCALGLPALCLGPVFSDQLLRLVHFRLELFYKRLSSLLLKHQCHLLLRLIYLSLVLLGFLQLLLDVLLCSQTFTQLQNLCI